MRRLNRLMQRIIPLNKLSVGKQEYSLQTTAVCNCQNVIELQAYRWEGFAGHTRVDPEKISLCPLRAYSQ